MRSSSPSRAAWFDRITDFTTGPDGDRLAFAAEVLEGFDPASSNLAAFFDLDGQADGTLSRVDGNGGGDGFVRCSRG
jgi:hypothetical protein